MLPVEGFYMCKILADIYNLMQLIYTACIVPGGIVTVPWPECTTIA